MLTIAEAQRRTEAFLTGQMPDALRTVEYELPSFDAEPRDTDLASAARSRAGAGVKRVERPHAVDDN